MSALLKWWRLLFASCASCHLRLPPFAEDRKSWRTTDDGEHWLCPFCLATTPN